MGTFHESILIAHPGAPKKTAALEAIVDTGATYSWIPKDILTRIRIKPVESRSLKIANGKIIKRKLGIILMTVHGKTMPTPVLFGNKGSTPLIGAVTLEELGFAVDPIHRTLVQTVAYLL